MVKKTILEKDVAAYTISEGKWNTSCFWGEKQVGYMIGERKCFNCIFFVPSEFYTMWMKVSPNHRNKNCGEMNTMLFDFDNEYKLIANLRCGHSKTICYQGKKTLVSWFILIKLSICFCYITNWFSHFINMAF